MGSTSRNDTRRALFLERLARSCDRRPDLTFGEIVGAAIPPERLAHLSDVEFADAIEAFMAPGPEPELEPEPETQR